MKRRIGVTKNTENQKIFEGVDNELIINGEFSSLDNLDETALNSAGLLCIKLKKNSRLPKRYQNRLEERQYEFLYIGKTKHLKKRISEQLGIESSGAFFRNIGCALGYLAKKSCLKGKSSKTSFVFSEEDEKSITKWLYENTEWSIVKYNGEFNIKKELIEKYRPFLNRQVSKNMKLQELEDDMKKCNQIARE